MLHMEHFKRTICRAKFSTTILLGCLFSDRVSLFILGCPGTLSGLCLELREIHLPESRAGIKGMCHNCLAESLDLVPTPCEYMPSMSLLYRQDNGTLRGSGMSVATELEPELESWCLVPEPSSRDHLPFSDFVSHPFCCWDRIPERKNLRKERLILAHCLGGLRSCNFPPLLLGL